MGIFQDWFWEINECGQGPHYYFNATFAPSDAKRLAALVRQHPLLGFEHCNFVGKLINAPCGDANTPGSYDLYVDQSNYAEVMSGIQRDEPIVTVAHYVWQIIGVCDRKFGIECGYGGITGTHNQADTSLIMTLAQSPELTLVDWRVVSGGDGYSSVFFRTGKSAAELLAYLQMRPEKPDFVQIERELRLALSDPALSKIYRLGECKINGWRLEVVVLHNIEKITSSYGGEGWDMTPHVIKLDKIAQTVSDKCKVPSCAGGAAHAPDDFYTLIGSHLSFGYPRRVG
ncbi:hypothetical protein IQ274_26715 [Nostoc sp. LEGE 12447]|uniref:hypothetical protein n=1 Tax=Nostoc sp. LEGE 12447 TaxID=1828640 RepID=UPI0018843560|nr:hypothetical protein [Nostoc sp. LEGE 12447]MBE9001703.1 hypothetical protein [Nostoc sp. LEGE 12447]